MCECYQIGGRFIAEDPDCPAHGRSAQLFRREGMSEEDAIAILRQYGVHVLGSDPVPGWMIAAVQAAAEQHLERFLEQ